MAAPWPSPRPSSRGCCTTGATSSSRWPFPVILYLLIGRQVNTKAYGIGFGAYYMIAMSTFGASAARSTGNAQRISQEKKEGWIRQLRLTRCRPAPTWSPKVLVSLATTIRPS